MSRRVAIACQGGGSHNAFTAGVLQGLLSALPDDVEIVALSGTSGGSICATLTWAACLRGNPALAIDTLEAFWRDNSASSLWDACVNYNLMWYASLMSFLPLPELSPYNFPNWAGDAMRRLLEKHIPFAELAALVHPKSPRLSVGAVDVLSGEFKAFSSHEPSNEICVEALLASTAIPTLFRSVEVKGRLYWDGLFSQNPPLQELTWTHPDEIWVIQINPTKRESEPQSMEEIRDRRNELAGNLSLMQEVRQIEFINQLLERHAIHESRHYTRIGVKWIRLERSLQYMTKLDRSPRFLQGLMAHGREQAAAFLRTPVSSDI